MLEKAAPIAAAITALMFQPFGARTAGDRAAL